MQHAPVRSAAWPSASCGTASLPGCGTPLPLSMPTKSPAPLCPVPSLQATRGVFVNPALQEPFGLTVIEAAAHGVPTVATKNGGPVVRLGGGQTAVCVARLEGLSGWLRLGPRREILMPSMGCSASIVGWGHHPSPTRSPPTHSPQDIMATLLSWSSKPLCASP